MFSLGKIAVGMVATVGVGAAVVVGAAEPAGLTQAVVARVIDGDTIDVDIAGRTERIRLLNIDTPETKDPNADVECLGPEAATHLQSLVPLGSTVTLEYDEVRTDRYGRTLAGVFTADRTLVNAEMARAGLATTVVYDGNDRFLPPVVAARDEAAAAGRGLYSPAVACSLVGQVTTTTAAMTAATAQAQRVVASPDASAEDLERSAAQVAAAAALTGRLAQAFDGSRSGLVWAAFSRSAQDRMAESVRSSHQAGLASEASLGAAADAARDRAAAEQSRRSLAAAPPSARAAAPERSAPPSAPARPAPTPPASSGGCESGYSPCVPSFPPDLDCGDLGGPYRVTGSDPHRLDVDGDGSGCE